jgi:hypothetical protein
MLIAGVDGVDGVDGVEGSLIISIKSNNQYKLQ